MPFYQDTLNNLKSMRTTTFRDEPTRNEVLIELYGQTLEQILEKLRDQFEPETK